MDVITSPIPSTSQQVEIATSPHISTEPLETDPEDHLMAELGIEFRTSGESDTSSVFAQVGVL